MKEKIKAEGYLLPEADPGSVKVGVGTVGRSSRLRIPRGWGHVILFEDAGSMLKALKEGSIAAAVRGELEARPFLEALREWSGVRRLFRVALLSTAGGKPFLFAPVGIDEGNSVRGQVRLVEYGRELLAELGWPDQVGLLAGGRKEDRGRCAGVDRSLLRAEEVARRTGAHLRHILIEEAVEEDRLIIAPDGPSGNLIYRTLVHLGGGGSHGAVYFPLEKLVLDTSRAAPSREYLEAVKLAVFLAVRRAGKEKPVRLK